MRKRFFLVLVGGIFFAFFIAAQELPPPPDNASSDYDAVIEDEGITVTGTRTQKRLKDSPVLTEVIGTEEIEGSNADTVVDILDDYGLVYTGNGMGDYVLMQGLGKNRVLYLINGRRVSGRIAQRLKGETLPLANVERIEIIRGPQSALYGSDALGGVINIITKKPPDKVAFSAALTNRFLLAYDDPNTSQTPDPFQDFNPIREQNLTSVISFPIGKARNSVDVEAARGGFYYNENKSASVLPEYYRGRLGFDSVLDIGNSELRFGGSGMLMCRDDLTTAEGALNRLDYLRLDAFVEADYWALHNLMLTFRLHDNYYQRNRDAYSAIRNKWTLGERYENDNIAALEVQGIYEMSSNLLFSGGIEGAFNSMEKYNLSRDFVWVDKEAVFFQAEYFTVDRYSAVAGLRIERNSQFGFAASPKLSGMYHLKDFRLLAGAGMGYRAPDFSDMYLIRDDEGAALVLGNPNLKPEYSLGFNAGLEYSKSKGFFQLNLYYNELFNEIGRIFVEAQGDSEAYYDTQNISRSMRLGADTEGRLSFSQGIFVSTGYSWLFAWDRSTNMEIFPQPNHTVKLKAGLDLAKIGVYTWLQGRYFSKFMDPSRTDSEARFILDFYFSVNLGKHVKFHFGVDNITGEMDRIGPETAQTFSVGIKYGQ
ncbi:MAG: TonB-dependent receptor [Treponema sp.]|jgi:outer membrane receptor for ferrienterochelin and colicins|nr:TonB-dependent receptor [Treponema sp.]